MALRIEVVTLFPELIRGALAFGVVGRALVRGLAAVGTEDPRDHTSDAHRTVDDRPYGGGPGMVLKPQPLLAAIRAAHARLPAGSPRSASRRRVRCSTSAARRSSRSCPGSC